MRQFFSPRFWFTLLALAGITAIAAVVFRHHPSVGGAAPVSTATGSTVPGGSTPHDPNPDRTVDLVSMVYLAAPAKGFALRDGVTTADLALILDGTRTMVVKKGTRGDNHCTHLTKVASCVVAADLLGDGVLWFSLIDGTTGVKVELPGIVEMIDTNWVRLANGWVMQRAALVARSCVDDTTSLRDFVTTFGAKSTSSFNLTTQRIEKVTCIK
ncbi:MAG: hypothetical protein WCI22_02385 [Actinomycetota bacterium]